MSHKHTCCKFSFGNYYHSFGEGAFVGEGASEQGLELEKENIIPYKKSPTWWIPVKMHTNKNVYPFIIIHTDTILSVNIFHLHNGSYVFFYHNHISERPLQIVLSFLEFGNVLPKEHREDFWFWVSYWC